MLDLAAGGRGGELKWLPGSVDFLPDGTVTYRP
jgi:hypothetical protein